MYALIRRRIWSIHWMIGSYALGQILGDNRIIYIVHTNSANAVVTPLRKAASYEQRKTNLGSSP